MPRNHLCTALLLVAFTVEFPAHGLERAATEKLPAGIHREMLPHSVEAGRSVELYWSEPKGDGRGPAVLFVHGHQYPDRPGGRYHVDVGDLALYTSAGLVAAAVSQPGYGASDGPPDFCGPVSQQAVRTALAFLRRHPRVDPDRIALYGQSRGAVVSSMVAVEDDRLAAVVLRGGIYDTADAYDRLDPETELGAGIRRNVERESGATPESFRARSALLTDKTSRVPTLFLHGETDDRSPVDQVRALAARLRDAGTPVEVVLFRDFVHRIPRQWQQPPVDRFFRRHLLQANEAP